MSIVVAAILALGLVSSLTVAWLYRKEMRTGSWRVHFLFLELTVRRFIWAVCIGLLVPSALGSLALARELRADTGEPGLVSTVAAMLVLGWGLVIGQKYFPGLPYHLRLRRPRFGPYLQFTPDGSIQISWDTPSRQPSILSWGDSPESLTNELVAGCDRPTRHHRLIIKGLEPGRRYFYRVQGKRERCYSFRAPPGKRSGDPVSFSVVGDPQSAAYPQRAIVDLITREETESDFVILAGDVVAADNDHAGWNTLFDHRSFGRIACETPLMAVIGNHEEHALELLPFDRGRSRFTERFQNEYQHGGRATGDSARIGHYFSFDYSNVHMIVLDSFDASPPPLLSEEQIAWLRADLARCGDVWRFITIHWPVYTITPRKESLPYVDQLEPILREHHVHAVFSGHEHVFQAFFRQGPDGAGGTHHFVLGGGGGALEDYTGARWGEARWPSWRVSSEIMPESLRANRSSAWFLAGEICHHYMQVLVDGDRAQFRAIRSPDGELIGSYNAVLHRGSGGLRQAG